MAKKKKPETPPVPLRRTLITIALGFLGGGLFKLLGFPMPWLVGAMIMLAFTACLQKKVEVGLPKPLRKFTIALLAIMVAGTIDLAVFKDAHLWTATLAVIPVLLILQFIFVQLLLKFTLSHEHFATRFFGGAAGGLLEMITLTKDHGGDERSALIMHMLRLSLLVLIVPIIFSASFIAPQSEKEVARALFDYDIINMALTFVALLVGVGLGKLLRLPAPIIVGPFLTSIACYHFGILSAAPPYAMLIVAKVLLGADLGSRFAGYSAKRISKLLLPTAGLTVLLAAISAGVSYGMFLLTDIPFSTLFLAYMPGGMTQMGIIAVALDLNASFVIAHLIARVICVIFLAPLCYKLMIKLLKKKGAPLNA